MSRIVFFPVGLALLLALSSGAWAASPDALTEWPESAMETYKAVLQNKKAFYSTDDKKYYLLDEFDYWNELDNLPLKAVRFAVVDMDGDGMPEIVLELTSGFDGAFEVLHYEEGTVFGFNHSYRGLLGLTSNGIYEGSNGAGVSGFFRSSFKKDTYSEEALGYTEYADDGRTTYHIGKEIVSEERYDEFLEGMWTHARENEAVWHEYTDAGVASVFK